MMIFIYIMTLYKASARARLLALSTHAAAGPQNGLSFGEIVIVVDMKCSDEFAFVDSQLVQSFVVIRDVVLSKCFVHLQLRSIVFPRVTRRVRVVRQVALKYVRYRLFTAHLQYTYGTN